MRYFSFVLILVLVACSCQGPLPQQESLPQKDDPTKALETVRQSVVTVIGEDATGCGVAVGSNAEHTYILTTYHVIEVVTFVHQDIETDSGIHFVLPFPSSRPGKTEVQIIENGEIVKYETEVLQFDADLDFAVLGVEKLPIPTTAPRPDFDLTVGQEVLSIGNVVSNPYVKPHFRGEFIQFDDRGFCVFNAHIHPGCSGGGFFVYDDGEWVLVALIQGVAVLGNKLLYDVSIGVPIKLIDAWMVDTLTGS